MENSTPANYEKYSSVMICLSARRRSEYPTESDQKLYYKQLNGIGYTIKLTYFNFKR